MELESERRRNMIFDSISNKENYKEEKEIYQTLNFLEKLKKWDDVESNAIIQKDWISANPVSFLSKDESECMYEAHRKHIDVHYIMEGIEKIATADVKNLQEKVPFDKDKDIGFYEGCESGSYLLKTGFQISGVETNSPDLVDQIDCAPLPKCVLVLINELLITSISYFFSKS